MWRRHRHRGAGGVVASADVRAVQIRLAPRIVRNWRCRRRRYDHRRRQRCRRPCRDRSCARPLARRHVDPRPFGAREHVRRSPGFTCDDNIAKAVLHGVDAIGHVHWTNPDLTHPGADDIGWYLDGDVAIGAVCSRREASDCTRNELVGIDPVTGDVRWTLPAAAGCRRHDRQLTRWCGPRSWATCWSLPGGC